MIGTGWLRRKAAARKPASGGIVRAEHGPELVSLPTGYLVPTATADSASPVPTGFVRSEAVLTDGDVEWIRRQLQITPRAKPDWGEPLTCTCVAVYSRCYYGH